ncbi:unnamed protein product [Moneuplotes crassus]|uniref:Uncharacterized protein n=1 Tax=Euplotes crassus TaxID=5936 RepID=A0AAD1UAZ9_EUPCR|nr:unnamed protein product [Moneuplotes crassus]
MKLAKRKIAPSKKFILCQDLIDVETPKLKTGMKSLKKQKEPKIKETEPKENNPKESPKENNGDSNTEDVQDSTIVRVLSVKSIDASETKESDKKEGLNNSQNTVHLRNNFSKTKFGCNTINIKPRSGTFDKDSKKESSSGFLREKRRSKWRYSHKNIPQQVVTLFGGVGGQKEFIIKDQLEKSTMKRLKHHKVSINRPFQSIPTRKLFPENYDKILTLDQDNYFNSVYGIEASLKERSVQEEFSLRTSSRQRPKTTNHNLDFSNVPPELLRKRHRHY